LLHRNARNGNVSVVAQNVSAVRLEKATVDRRSVCVIRSGVARALPKFERVKRKIEVRRGL
jgi:hypothetical protein